MPSSSMPFLPALSHFLSVVNILLFEMIDLLHQPPRCPYDAQEHISSQGFKGEKVKELSETI